MTGKGEEELKKDNEGSTKLIERNKFRAIFRSDSFTGKIAPLERI